MEKLVLLRSRMSIFPYYNGNAVGLAGWSRICSITRGSSREKGNIILKKPTLKG